MIFFEKEIFDIISPCFKCGYNMLNEGLDNSVALFDNKLFALGGSHLKPAAREIVGVSNRLFQSSSLTGLIGVVEVSLYDEVFFVEYKIDERGNILIGRVTLKSVESKLGSFSNLNLGMELESSDLASVEVCFRTISTIRREVNVSSKILTRSGFEGKGYSMALAFLSDIAIRDIISRHANRFDNFNIVGVVNDVACAQAAEISRNFWSSRIYSALGYYMANSRSRSLMKKFK